MLDQGLRQAIFELSRKGNSRRIIARTLRISRSSVARVLESGTTEVPRPERPEKAEEHHELIRDLVAECEGSFLRVHEELGLRGIALAYPTLTAYCRRHGLGHKPMKPVGRYHFEPGAEMQHDTSPHHAWIGGRVRPVQIASLVLAYSRMMYFQLYPQFRRFECKCFLSDAVQYMGGACASCMIDNTGVIVLKGTGREMVPVPEMVAFAERIGPFAFEAHEKGDANRSARVEQRFRLIQRAFLPGRKFADWADANARSREWCDHINARFSRRLKASPRELFAAERPAMRRLPRWIPEPYEIHHRVVDMDGYVTLATNRYSVPVDLIGRQVEVRETKSRVLIYRGPREVASHAREVDHVSRYIFNAAHRPPRGQGGHRTRDPFPEEHALLKALPEIESYVAALRKLGRLQTTLALRQLLRMAREYPREPLLAAIRTAAHYGLYDLERLERMVLRAIATDYFVLPLDPSDSQGDDDEPTDGGAPPASEDPSPQPDGRDPA